MRKILHALGATFIINLIFSCFARPAFALEDGNKVPSTPFTTVDSVQMTTAEDEEPEAQVATWEFAYTGEVETWTAPVDGLYTLCVWGAEGGSVSSDYHGGKGGYSYAPLVGYNSYQSY